jgi:uncharacterized protein (DUF1501 family)
MTHPTRRGFVAGCSAAIAGMAGARFPSLAFADPSEAINNEILVVVFLPGGMDGLNMVVPISGADRGYYEAARPNIAVPVGGAGSALSLDGQFGFHGAAAPLHQLYQAGKVAVVNATGLNEASRSHFDSQEFIERGTPGVRTTSTGWLARHFATADNLPAEIVMPSVSVGNLQATSLLGDRNTINMSNPGSFNLQLGPWEWRDAQRVALRHMYSGDTTWLHEASLQALDAMDVVELNSSGSYTPSNGAVYPSGSFGNGLQVIAQMVKLNLGLRVATFDLGGWDTHVGQGDDGGGYFAGIVATLSEGLTALYTDLDGGGAGNYTQRLTMVVQSEFGRRLFENADEGTDHGHGNPMIVISGNAVPGVHGDWPGLGPGQLFDNADLAVTTDFRRVLSEILIRRMGNNHLGMIFPGYADYQPLGIVGGDDLPPDYTTTADIILSDGFESGNTGRWTSTVG